MTAAPRGAIVSSRKDTTDPYDAAAELERLRRAEPPPDNEVTLASSSTSAASLTQAQETASQTWSISVTSQDTQDASPSATSSLVPMQPVVSDPSTDLEPGISPTTTSTSDDKGTKFAVVGDTVSSKEGASIPESDIVGMVSFLIVIVLGVGIAYFRDLRREENCHRRLASETQVLPSFRAAVEPPSLDHSEPTIVVDEDKKAGQVTGTILSIRGYLLPGWRKYIADSTSTQPDIVVTPPQDEVPHIPLSPSMVLARRVNRTTFLHPNSAHRVFRQPEIKWIDVDEDSDEDEDEDDDDDDLPSYGV